MADMSDSQPPTNTFGEPLATGAPQPDTPPTMEAGMLLMNTVDEPFANDPPPCSEHEQLLPHAIAAGTPLMKTRCRIPT